MRIRRNGREFEADGSPSELWWGTVASGEWEPQSFAILDRFLRPGGTFLDIGCFVGPLSFYAAAGGARVVALDPDPSAGEGFRRNLELNPELAPRVSFLPLAVGEQNEDVPLFARSGYGLSSSSLLRRTRDRRASVTARSVTLSSLAREVGPARVDLVKVDVEGGEFLFLPGARDALAALGRPTSYVSFHFGSLREFRFRQLVPLRVAARVLEKGCRLVRLDPFRRRNRDLLGRVLAAFEDYPFAWDAFGRPFDRERLEKDPWLLDGRDLVVSTRSWEETSPFPRPGASL